MELMLITDPEPCRRIGSDDELAESAKTDSRLTRRTSWKLCSSVCRSGPPDDMPALLTSTSIRPKRSSAVRTSSPRSASTVTSQRTGWIAGSEVASA